MAKSETYREAEIRAHVYQRPDIPPGKFLVEGWISFDGGNSVYDQHWLDEGLYDTEEAAHNTLIASAKKFIDDILK